MEQCILEGAFQLWTVSPHYAATPLGTFWNVACSLFWDSSVIEWTELGVYMSQSMQTQGVRR